MKRFLLAATAVVALTSLTLAGSSSICSAACDCTTDACQCQADGPCVCGDSCCQNCVAGDACCVR